MVSGKKKILVVDDEKDIRDTVCDVLTDAGFSVETAINGKNMFTKLKTRPDLIILDILMPGLTTYEIIEKMKKQKLHTPIIFLSVVRFGEQTKNIIYDNMVDYIEKPFDNVHLVKIVKKALP